MGGDIGYGACGGGRSHTREPQRMADEPTLGEVIRRLDAITAQLTEVVREIKDEREKNAATFVRQDVYVAQRQADAAVVADLHSEIRGVKEDRKRDVDWKRQQNLALAGLAITTLVSIALAVIGFIVR